MLIISIAQQARPNIIGQSEFRLHQLYTRSRLVIFTWFSNSGGMSNPGVFMSSLSISSLFSNKEWRISDGSKQRISQ
jgi:hypothetical protein